MYNLNNEQIKIKNYIKNHLSESRFKHSCSVCQTALLINKANSLGIDESDIIYASLLHDASKYMSLDEMRHILDSNHIEYNKNYTEALLHAKVSTTIAKSKFNINCSNILNAINYHTTGRASMSILEKLIYSADYLEPLRKLQKADEIRIVAMENFQEAFTLTVLQSINFIVSNRKYLDLDSIEMYNNYVQESYR